MSFSQSFLEESLAVIQAIDTAARGGMCDRSGFSPRPRRAAVRARRRRLGGTRLPCCERLPQDLRLRGLRADRQRLRAHRAHQRRGLGDLLLRVAAWLAPARETTRCSCFSVGGGDAERRCVHQPRARSRARDRTRAAPSSASSGRTGASRQRLPTPASSSHRCSPTRTTPHTEGLCAGHLAPSREPPGPRPVPDQVGVRRREHRCLT